MNNCASSSLPIKTYYAGRDQVTHPSVISFDTPWHGYMFYMSYTPYPFGNGAEENPCLAASNDCIHWEVPKGLINPIATCEETECDELKDAHLLYREDLDRLEIWYLGRIKSSIKEGGPLHIFRKCSHDGINWTKRETLYTLETIMVSPSIIWDGYLYSVWFIQNLASYPCAVLKMTSHDGITWSSLELCNIPKIQEYDIWHGSVNIIESKYYLTFVGKTHPYNQNIYICVSEDGISFNSIETIIENNVGWKFLYRPCLIKTDKTYYLFYGVNRLDNRWLICASCGAEINEMVGIDSGVELEANKPERLKLQIKNVHKNILSMFPLNISLLIPIFAILCFLPYPTIVLWFLFCITSFLYRIVALKEKPLFKCILGGIINGTTIGGICFLLKNIII